MGRGEREAAALAELRAAAATIGVTLPGDLWVEAAGGAVWVGWRGQLEMRADVGRRIWAEETAWEIARLVERRQASGEWRSYKAPPDGHWGLRLGGRLCAKVWPDGQRWRWLAERYGDDGQFIALDRGEAESLHDAKAAVRDALGRRRNAGGGAAPGQPSYPYAT